MANVNGIIFDIFPADKSHLQVNMKLIGQIKVGDKLTTANDCLQFETRPWFFQKPLRAVCLENGMRTMDVIEVVLQDCVNIVNLFLNHQWRIGIALQTPQGKAALRQKISEVLQDLQRCIDGLLRLRVTYEHDRTVATRIDVAVKKLDADIKSIQTHLHALI